LTRILDTYPEVSQALNRSRTRREATINPPAAADTNDVIPQRLRSRLSSWLHGRYDAAISR